MAREVEGISTPERVAALREQLERLLGVPVEVKRADSYPALMQLFVHEEVDAAWLTPAMIVEASRREKLALIAATVRNGARDYRGSLAVLATSTFQSLDDLRGTRAGWVDPWSAAGYLFPRRLLRHRGFDPAEFFSQQGFFGTHRGLLRALTDGKIDVAATYLDTEGPARFLSGEAVRPLRAVARTEPIPGDGLCVGAALPSDQVEWLAERFSSVDVRPVAAIFDAEAFVRRPLSDYKDVRAALEDEWGRSSSDVPEQTSGGS